MMADGSSMLRRIVITGSSSGIGHVLAQRLTQAGHQVWGISRRAQTDFPSFSSGRFQHSCCDVSDLPAIQATAREIREGWPCIDALICCAGIQGSIGPAMTLEPAAWSATVRGNIDGTFYPIAAFYPALGSTGRRAKILCFFGGGAAAPRPNFSAYGVAKAGIVRLMETLSHEWTSEAIDINAIAPGALPTRLTQETLALGPSVVGELEFASAQKTAALGAASFERVCGLVEYLLSTASDGITGRLISAPWDPWPDLAAHAKEISDSDLFTLRRIVPADRGKAW